MTKSDLAERIANSKGLTKKAAAAVIEKVFSSVTDALRAGGKVEIRGFGSFRLKHRRNRIGRNPKTGAKVMIPAKRVPYFTSGKDFYNKVSATEK